jgi:hypothetical protein
MSHQVHDWCWLGVQPNTLCVAVVLLLLQVGAMPENKWRTVVAPRAVCTAAIHRFLNITQAVCD